MQPDAFLCLVMFLIGAADLNVNYQCILMEEMINLLYLASV